ncbi:hypothetical protein Nmel_007001 [Mimus melanotis]
MNKGEGPHELIVWGCRYVCISTDTGVHWLPARCLYYPENYPALACKTRSRMWPVHNLQMLLSIPINDQMAPLQVEGKIRAATLYLSAAMTAGSSEMKRDSFKHAEGLQAPFTVSITQLAHKSFKKFPPLTIHDLVAIVKFDQYEKIWTLFLSHLSKVCKNRLDIRSDDDSGFKCVEVTSSGTLFLLPQRAFFDSFDRDTSAAYEGNKQIRSNRELSAGCGRELRPRACVSSTVELMAME